MVFPCSFFPFPSALDWEYYQSFSWQNALTRIIFRAAQWSLLLQHWHSLPSCFALSELFQWNFSGKSWLKSDWNFTSTIIFDNFNTEIKINTIYSHKKWRLSFLSRKPLWMSSPYRVIILLSLIIILNLKMSPTTCIISLCRWAGIEILWRKALTSLRWKPVRNNLEKL